LAYTPHTARVLKEVRNRKSVLITPIARDWHPNIEHIADVKVVQAWRHRSLPTRNGGQVTIPRYVSNSLYQAIEEHLPHLAREGIFLRALVYLKLVATLDPRSGYLPFHEKAVAHIRGAPSLADRHEAGVYDLAKRLQKALLKDLPKDFLTGGAAFSIISHRVGTNCVQITPFRLPEPVEEAFEQERERLFLSGDARSLETGNKKRPADRTACRKKRRRKAEQTAGQYDVPDRLQRLQHRLHELPRKRFTSALKSARDELNGLVMDRRREQDHSGRVPYLSQLRRIADVVVPVYKFTGSTLRLTPAGPSLAALPKKMRRAVLDDYLEVDMSSAQLALAGSLWDLSDLRDFLTGCRGSDKSWWAELTRWLAQELPAPRYRPDEHFGRVKGVLKGFTYGLFYGMHPRNLRRLGNPHSSSTDPARYYKSIRMMSRLFLGGMRRPFPRKRVQKIGAALFRHPLVGQLMQRRQQILSRIESDGGITDCFGRHVTTSEGRDPKSVLAEFMQNAELRVMLPVGEQVLDDPELKFGLWQHDGVTIAPKRRKPRAYRKAVRRAREALQQGREALSEEMGIPPIETELTVDYGEERLKS
jgi:hypothetical protein